MTPEGLPKYVVPPPSFLEPSEKNVGYSSIPEKNCIEREEPIQLGNDTQLVENEEEERKYIRFYR